MSDREILEGIRPDRVEREYEGRGLGTLSDADLLSAAIHSIARPAVTQDSFSVHAPLELLARFILLNRVAAPARELARQQIVGLVAWYTNRYDRLPISALRSHSAVNPVTAALRAVRTQDGPMADVAASLICELSTVDEVLRGLSDEFITRIDVSAHSHIFLRLLREFNLQYPEQGLPLVRNFLAYLTRQAPVRQSWPLTIRDVAPGPADPDIPGCGDWVARMLNPARTQRPKTGGIRAMVQATEAAEVLSAIDIAEVARDVMAGSHAALRAACRIGPHSMLAESSEHAKYGWTHCLTLPEAIWCLNDVMENIAIGSAAAVEFAVAYRSTIGTLELGANLVTIHDQPTERDRRDAVYAFAENLRTNESAAVSALISGACVRSDCHLVKYTLSALTAAERDSEATELYLSSAASLLALWQREIPDSAIGSDLARRELRDDCSANRLACAQ